MSGHSKWATIKHRKGAADAKRGKLFAKLIKQVEVAARAGGGDLDANPTLRSMYQKARDNSVPIDTIERAVKRGTGEMDGVTYESVTYEGYAPGGVALYIECLTDNRNRTGSEVRSTLSRNGGSLAAPGAVAWQFQRKGVVLVSSAAAGEEELMMLVLDAGAEDLQRDGDLWRVTTEPGDLEAVRNAVADSGVAIAGAELTMVATSTAPVTEPGAARQVLKLIDLLDDLDDVQDVYGNFDIRDELMEEMAG